MNGLASSEPIAPELPDLVLGSEELLATRSAAKPALLVLGLGNDILTDDAVGLVVASRLADRFASHQEIAIVESQQVGLGLLDLIVGHRDLVVIDSVQTGRVPPGHLHEVDEAHINTLPGMSPHFLGVGEILTLGRLLGMPMPVRVTLFAVEAEAPCTLGTTLSESVNRSLPRIVDRIATRTAGWAATSADAVLAGGRGSE